MANNENLTPWKKGQSGNPKGKPKGTRHLGTIIRDMLDDPKFAYQVKGVEVRGNAAEAMVATLIIKAIQGDIRAFDTLAKYGYGTKLDLTSDNKPIPMPILGGLSLKSSKEIGS
jgi:hypothetical protein